MFFLKRAILLSWLKDQIPPNLPENIYHTEFEPLDKLLSQSAAFIYHGGIGSLAQATASGVPQLVMPMSLDQPDNAARIKKLEAGNFVLPRNFKPRLVADKLSDLLSNPKVRENYQKYAQRVDFDQAILDACNLLERFSSDSRLI